MGARRRDENLREAMLDAAERLLEDGPQAVTSRSVQRAAGVSSGTFFHYFPTLDDLLLTLATRAAARQPATFGRDAGLGSVLGRLFDPERRDTVLPWLRQRAVDAPALQAALRHYDAAVSEQFVSQVRTALGGSGGLDGIDVEATVEVVRALAEGFQLRVSSGTSTVAPDRLSRAAIAFVIRAAVERPTA